MQLCATRIEMGVFEGAQALTSSSEPRGLLADGKAPLAPGAVPSDGDAVSAGAALGAIPPAPRSVLIALENEAVEMFEIMRVTLAAKPFPNR